MRKLGIIAGGGELPGKLAEHAAFQGRAVHILGIKGFAEAELLGNHPSDEFAIGEIGKLIKASRRAGVEDLCFAGIVKRPDFKAIKVDAKGVLLLPRVIAAAARGDDALLRTMVEIFEGEGFSVVGADDVLNGLLATAGALTSRSPEPDDMKDLAKAANVASEIGRLDIGQGAVCCGGLVLAVEAQEGTDNMLMRCAELPLNLRGEASARRGVLVKRPKPGQERRIDLPTIGVATVMGAANAGLVGIGVEAGAALILDRENVIQAADAAGLWIYGFSDNEVSELVIE